MPFKNILNFIIYNDFVLAIVKLSVPHGVRNGRRGVRIFRTTIK